MSTDLFNSSDTARSAAPLMHARAFRMPDPLQLELGGSLSDVVVTYETYGKLSPQKDNAVLVCHALSGDSHVARHTPDDSPGWWDLLVGPGRHLDTTRYFVICANVLGGCRGTTGPNSVNPATGRPYGADFPDITVGDMVEVQRRLLDHLGIERLLAVIGGSMGGHQAMTWALRYPDRVRGAIVVASSPRLTSQALAFDVVGRNAILRDPHYHGGQYYDKPDKPRVGLALARMLGHITYLSREAMDLKFDPDRTDPRKVATEFEIEYSVGSYLAHQGNKFVERFDANSYVVLSRAMDQFDLGGTHEKLRREFARSTCRWLVLSFTSDWLFPPQQSRQIVDALVAEGRPVSYCNIVSNCGHDAFLLADDLPAYGGMIASFLDNLPGGPRETAGTRPACGGGAAAAGAIPGGPGPGDDDVEALAAAGIPGIADPTSIFHGYRLDYDQILDLIEPGSSVLDLGCGGGDLLALARDRLAPRRLVGVELNQGAVAAAIGRGVDVLQLDLEEPLSSFPDGAFDVVVLSQTLQAVSDTERVVREMLRVGRRGIVSIPNFAYHKLRRMLAEEGRSPKTAGIYSYEWYNTPNRRFASILDFRDFCRTMGFAIDREVYLDTEADRRLGHDDDPNLNADLAIFVLRAR